MQMSDNVSGKTGTIGFMSGLILAFLVYGEVLSDLISKSGEEMSAFKLGMLISILILITGILSMLYPDPEDEKYRQANIAKIVLLVFALLAWILIVSNISLHHQSHWSTLVLIVMVGVIVYLGAMTSSELAN